VWGCTLATGIASGWQWWQLGAYLGGALALLSVIWQRQRLSDNEIEIGALRENVRIERSGLQDERNDFNKRQEEARIELDKMVSRVERREQSLADRFSTYHEWTEFPRPLDLNSEAAVAEPTDSELSELAAKDRLMVKLLEEESQVIFESIRTNKYVVEGKLHATLLRDDAYDLIRRVAIIYQPGIEHPLLETSLERVLRAASRASLQFLVVLDQLPVDAKQYNIKNMYAYVRRAVEFYGMYKRVEPYWPYINGAYYIGRFAMGAKPLTLGAWWIAGTLGSRGAQVLANRLINQQAVAFLHNIIRVIGFEVAGIYGGDFRHRDANWIYGAELVEMLSHFQASHASLSQGMKEVGALQLRSEYDRIYLYRLLTAHQGSNPERYRASVCLSPAERQAVARRLEKFLSAFLRRAPDKKILAWRDEAQQRLNIQLQLPESENLTLSLEAQVDEAIRSLASYVLSVKEQEIDEIEASLDLCSIWQELGQTRKKKLFDAIRQNPPYFFEHPDIVADGKLAGQFLDDLATLAARVPPYTALSSETALDAGAWLRHDAPAVNARLDKAFNAVWAEHVVCDSRRKLPQQVVSAALCLRQDDEPLRFLFGNVRCQFEPGEAPPGAPAADNAWLLAVGDRLVVFTADPTPRAVWKGDRQVTMRKVRGYISNACEITGGQWIADPQTPAPTIVVAGSSLAKYETFFRPLLEFQQ